MSEKRDSGHFRTVKASKETIGEVERLMRQQAEHHNHAYEGNTKDMLLTINGDNPLMEAFLVYKPEVPDHAVCCTLYRMVWTFDGKAAYLEDICTDSNHRGGGIGRFAIQEMQKYTLARGGNAIIGAVAKDNTATMGFWRANGYGPLPKNSYDLSNVFNDSSALEKETSYTATRVSAPDSVLPAFLQPAVSDPTVGVFVVKDNSDKVSVALALVNAKFSSATTKTGVLIEPVNFLTQVSVDERQDVLRTVIKASLDFAKANGYTSHLYALTKSDCVVSNEFINDVGIGPRYESSSPDSILVSMGLSLK